MDLISKKEIEEKLLRVDKIDLDQRLVSIERFSEFKEVVKQSLSESPDMNLRKMMLQKFVSRIEVGIDKVKIFWNVDRDHYDREITLNSDFQKEGAPSGVLSSNQPRSLGSKSLTSGGTNRVESDVLSKLAIVNTCKATE